MKKNVVGLIRNIAVVIMSAALAMLCSGCGLFDVQSEPFVYISQSVINLEEGETAQLAAVSDGDSEINWISGNEAVATVSSGGLITAVAEGESLITAITSSALASCTVKVSRKQQTVTPEPEPIVPAEKDYIVISLDAIEIEVGKSITLKAVTSSEAAVEWGSMNMDVASVENGVVIGLKEGKSTIVARVGQTVARCTVEVIAAVKPQPETPDGSEKDGYRLVWRDEFEGNALDTTKWGYQTGIRDIYHGYDTQNWFWGNGELQYYTQDAVSVADGSLKITATRQTMSDGRTYKSGRIFTRDLASWTYGYFEARIKTPKGNGMWPAFWMLPQPSSYANVNNEYGGWPANGEIDIMEAKGRLGNVVDTTLHFGAEGGHDYAGKATTLSSDTDEWHTYAVDWTADGISWFIDGNKVFNVTKNRWWSQNSGNQGQPMPFDKPFYLLINLAVGGQYDGGIEPDGSFTSASMFVDYVRVYERV